MGVVIPFPRAPRAPSIWPPADLAALDRLVDRMRPTGAVAWEFDPARSRAYIIGPEDETLLIVSRSAQGLSVASGWRHELLWQGPSLERFA